MNKTRQVLWTDFFKKVGAGAGESGIRRDFAVVRRGGLPFLYLPAGGLAVARALDLYPAQSSKARLGKLLLACGLRCAPARLLGLENFTHAIPPGDAFAVYLSQAAGIPDGSIPLFGVLRGNPNAAGRRDVFLLFDSTQQPVAVVKAGQGDAARKLIAREEALLKSLPAQVTGAPRLRAGYASASAQAFAMDFVPGKSPRGDATVPLARLLDSWLDESRSLPLAELPAWRRLLAASTIEPLPKSVLALSELQVRPALVHGDLAPWNVKVSPGGWTVLDWERGELTGVPGWDWFHFEIQPAVLVRRESTERLLSGLERLLASTEFMNYASRAGILEHSRTLAVAYLAFCSRVTRQTEGREQVLILERATAERWFSGRT